jgi:hypothetical protein
VLVWFDRQAGRAVVWMIWTGKQSRAGGRELDSSRERVIGCDRVRYDQRQQPQRATLLRSL